MMWISGIEGVLKKEKENEQHAHDQEIHGEMFDDYVYSRDIAVACHTSHGTAKQHCGAEEGSHDFVTGTGSD
jgi:hypothetical protein